MCRGNIRSDSEKNNEDTKRKKFGWRRGWDSNPRDPFGPNGFQDRRSQPLSYPSDEKRPTNMRKFTTLAEFCGPSLWPDSLLFDESLHRIRYAFRQPLGVILAREMNAAVPQDSRNNLDRHVVPIPSPGHSVRYRQGISSGFD